jgi:hypothetical protein
VKRELTAQQVWRFVDKWIIDGFRFDENYKWFLRPTEDLVFDYLSIEFKGGQTPDPS